MASSGQGQQLLQLFPAGKVVVRLDLAVAHVVERGADPLQRDAGSSDQASR